VSPSPVGVEGAGFTIYGGERFTTPGCRRQLRHIGIGLDGLVLLINESSDPLQVKKEFYLAAQANKMASNSILLLHQLVTTAYTATQSLGTTDGQM